MKSLNRNTLVNYSLFLVILIDNTPFFKGGYFILILYDTIFSRLLTKHCLITKKTTRYS